jgi:hypothetical protein
VQHTLTRTKANMADDETLKLAPAAVRGAADALFHIVASKLVAALPPSALLIARLVPRLLKFVIHRSTL